MKIVQLPLAAVALCCLVAAPHGYAGELERLADIDLPADVRPQDIRWKSDDEIVITLGLGGVGELAVTSDSSVPEITIPGADDGGFLFSSRLALSGDQTVLASPFSGLSWADRAGRLQESVPFGWVVDVDAHDQQVAILGWNRGDDGHPKDGIVWVGTLEKHLEDLRPIAFGNTEDGSWPLVVCDFLELGAVRFLADGSLLVMSGVEPGLYRYEAGGRLLETWDTTPLDLIDDCPLSLDDKSELGPDPRARSRFLNRWRTVEDLIPLGDRGALIIRSVDGKGPRWELATMETGGEWAYHEIPVRADSPHAHLRGDSHGDRIAFLLMDYDVPGQKGPAIVERVVITSTP